jgi:hypothetical protein
MCRLARLGLCSVFSEALGLPVVTLFMCDRKQPITADYVQCVHGDLGCCFFCEAHDILATAGQCCTHGRPCPLPAGPVDFVVAGFPCNPFSAARSNKRAVPAHLHPDFQTYRVTIEYVRVKRPGGGMFEQVPGFLSQLPPDGTDEHGRPLPSSWAAHLILELRSYGYFVQALKMDNEIWSEFPRYRLVCLRCVGYRCHYVS